MASAKRWSVEIFIDEHDEQRLTRAEARLHTGSDTHLVGTGVARRDPGDGEVPEIGDEVAAARALFALGRELLGAAEEDIEQITREPAALR